MYKSNPACQRPGSCKSCMQRITKIEAGSNVAEQQQPVEKENLAGCCSSVLKV